MRGIYYNGEDAFYREDLPLPERKEGESLIKIIYATICSTDKEVLKGYRPDFRGIMGHEWVGVVISSDDKGLEGRRVVGEINENCGECIYCRTGRPHHCSTRKTPGLSRDGAFAEYMTVRDDLLHLVPESLPSDVAVYTEPLAAAYEILEEITIEKGERVGLIGDGRLALCIASMLHAEDICVTIMGKHEEKLALFNDLGETRLSVPDEEYEIVIEASGNPGGLESALKAVRKRGMIVLKSTFSQNVSLDISRIVVDELTLLGSRCGPFDKALSALESGRIKLPLLEKYSLPEYRKAFLSSAFKAAFYMGDD